MWCNIRQSRPSTLRATYITAVALCVKNSSPFSTGVETFNDLSLCPRMSFYFINLSTETLDFSRLMYICRYLGDPTLSFIFLIFFWLGPLGKLKVNKCFFQMRQNSKCIRFEGYNCMYLIHAHCTLINNFQCYKIYVKKSLSLLNSVQQNQKSERVPKKQKHKPYNDQITVTYSTFNRPIFPGKNKI